MNPVEQRQRFTAVQTVERRVDDLETVLNALAAEIVEDRKAWTAQMLAIRAFDTAVIGLTSQVNEIVRQLADRPDKHATMAKLKDYVRELAAEQRGDVDAQDRELQQSITRLEVRTVLLCHSTLWTRLRWLLGL